MVGLFQNEESITDRVCVMEFIVSDAPQKGGVSVHAQIVCTKPFCNVGVRLVIVMSRLIVVSL